MAIKTAMAATAISAKAGLAVASVASSKGVSSTYFRVRTSCLAPSPTRIYLHVHLAFVDNAGDGGRAGSGNAILGTGLGNGANTVKSGPGGNAKGGDVNGVDGLVNILSGMLFSI